MTTSDKTYEARWIDVPLDDVLEFFASKYEFADGAKLDRMEAFADTGKGRVAFKLTVTKDAPKRLKPCPKCGLEYASHIEYGNPSGAVDHRFHCDKCAHETSRHPAIEQAIEEWNSEAA